MKRFAMDLPQGEAFTGVDAAQQRLSRLKKRRKVWLSVHLWLGLLLGFFLVVFGATGSILVFYEEIDNVLNADLRSVQAPSQGEAAVHSFAEIQAAAAAMPPQAKLGFVDYPGDADPRTGLVSLFQHLSRMKRMNGRSMLIPIRHKYLASS